MAHGDLGEHAPFAPLLRLRVALDEVAALPVVERAAQLARAKRRLAALLAERRWLDRHGRGNPPYPRHRNGMLAMVVAPAYTIYVGSFAPRFRTAIHDHKTWGLVGTWQGQEVEQRFRIVERAADGRVRFAPTRGQVNDSGRVSVLIPGIDEIHQVGNVRRRPAYSVHVYGYGSARPPQHSTWYSRPDADGWSRVLDD
jgi:predicted metal-dependent enzyme (double-stranded beta helix superfamily)